jgi:hypothetical protein
MVRVFGLLAAVIAMAAGMYVYSRQAQSASVAAGANNPKAAISITGVKADLISIATSERRFYATEGKYASLDELISANYISIARQRPPYSYEVESSSDGFLVVATRAGEDGSGLPARLSVDENMEFKTSQ